MFAEFETFIKQNTTLSDAEISLMRSMAIEKSVRKNEFLLQEGEICRHKVFVSKGLLSTFCMKEDGTEHIINFSPENTWSTEADSYHHHLPSRYNINVLEDSELIMWTKSSFDELFIQIPHLKIYSDKLVSDILSYSRQRIYLALSSTAEERYDEFLRTFPGMISRVPLHTVAAYLGVTRKTLSRIRHAQLKK